MEVPMRFVCTAKATGRTVTLAISSSGIAIHDGPNTTTYDYRDIVTWCGGRHTFMVATGNLIHMTKEYFETPQAGEMNAIVREHVQAYLIEQNQQEEK